MIGFILDWGAGQWKYYRLRKRMHGLARLMMQAREAGPELYRYVEMLENQVDRQERELNHLRWTVGGERLADLDLEQDRLEWRQRVETTLRQRKAGGIKY
jgi:hypothetical protein